MVSSSLPTGKEIFFDEEEIIVSKTDLTGRITYANQVLVKVSGYGEDELIGQPHSIIRHPEMPRCVYKLLWDVIGSGREIFAYVNNLAKNGDHYWVFAHVTPTFNEQGKIIGYHSSRRKPRADAIKKIAPIYALLLEEEAKHTNRKDGLVASFTVVQKLLEEQGMDYAKFVFSL